MKPHIPSRTVYDLTKAGKNGILLYAILDESGSMGGVQDATIEGFNGFVSSQKAVKDLGEATLTTMKFDAPALHKLYVNRPINEVPLLNREAYQPRGGTNLNDAIGTAISDINNILSGLSEEKRPGVLVLIMTDGYENSSQMFNATDVKNLVRSAQDQDWTFTFLGANIDAFAVGNLYGFHGAAVASYSVENTAHTHSVMSNMATGVRSAKMAGMHTHDIYATASMYSSKDRDEMLNGTKDAK